MVAGENDPLGRRSRWRWWRRCRRGWRGRSRSAGDAVARDDDLPVRLQCDRGGHGREAERGLHRPTPAEPCVQRPVHVEACDLERVGIGGGSYGNDLSVRLECEGSDVTSRARRQAPGAKPGIEGAVPFVAEKRRPLPAQLSADQNLSVGLKREPAGEAVLARDDAAGAEAGVETAVGLVPNKRRAARAAGTVDDDPPVRLEHELGSGRVGADRRLDGAG